MPQFGFELPKLFASQSVNAPALNFKADPIRTAPSELHGAQQSPIIAATTSEQPFLRAYPSQENDSEDQIEKTVRNTIAFLEFLIS